MPLGQPSTNGQLHGHALRNLHLREKSLRRAEGAPPLARLLVTIRAKELGMTRLEFSRRSGISRGTLRDLELGIHAPTRRLLQRLLSFYKRAKVKSELLDEVRRLYTGPRGTLTELISWLEVQTGSARELARRVGISPSTLWEYRRGRFPLPLSLFREICRAGGEEMTAAEQLWHSAERQRLLGRGYPESLAEFWALCHRAELAEKDLPGLGIGTAALRKLRYLEIPPWEQVASTCRSICRCDEEFNELKRLWTRGECEQREKPVDTFGLRLRKLRLTRGIVRRELADLFGIGGKKPAQSVKHIEEGGAYSAHAYPEGLVAVLSDDPAQRSELVRLWEKRRARFLLRHRPETWVQLRLRREAFGYEIREMESILGYSPLEYQRIERGVVRLSEPAQARVLTALEKAGQQRVIDLLARRKAEQLRLDGWQAPTSVVDMVSLLIEREGGLVPLTRLLKQSGVLGIWPGRLKAIASGREVPPWPVIQGIGLACRVGDFAALRDDWHAKYRRRLEVAGIAPLGVEVRLLIGETAPSARALSPKLQISYPVLTRDLQRIDRGKPVRWQAIERILTAAKADPNGQAWERIEAWWLSTARKR